MVMQRGITDFMSLNPGIGRVWDTELELGERVLEALIAEDNAPSLVLWGRCGDAAQLRCLGVLDRMIDKDPLNEAGYEEIRRQERLKFYRENIDASDEVIYGWQ